MYNDEHMGDYVGVVVHFTNQATEHAQGGVSAWCRGWRRWLKGGTEWPIVGWG